MATNFSTKYHLGARVFIVDKKTKEVPCEACSGKGEVVLKGKTYECPSCYGFKKDFNFVCWEIKPVIIIEVQIKSDRDQPLAQIDYRCTIQGEVFDNYRFRPESEVYETRKLARKALEKIQDTQQ